jgi:hypothetical protein
MNRVSHLRPAFVEFMPEPLEPGVFYISICAAAAAVYVSSHQSILLSGIYPKAAVAFHCIRPLGTGVFLASPITGLRETRCGGPAQCHQLRLPK